MKDDNKKPAEQRENRLAQQRQRRQQETEKRLQRPQICTEASTKYHNYPANETDEEREHRLPTLQENAANRIRNESETPFLFRLTIPDILWASPELREILRSTYF